MTTRSSSPPAPHSLFSAIAEPVDPAANKLPHELILIIFELSIGGTRAPLDVLHSLAQTSRSFFAVYRANRASLLRLALRTAIEPTGGTYGLAVQLAQQELEKTGLSVASTGADVSSFEELLLQTAIQNHYALERFAVYIRTASCCIYSGMDPAAKYETATEVSMCFPPTYPYREDVISNKILKQDMPRYFLDAAYVYAVAGEVGSREVSEVEKKHFGEDFSPARFYASGDIMNVLAAGLLWEMRTLYSVEKKNKEFRWINPKLRPAILEEDGGWKVAGYIMGCWKEGGMPENWARKDPAKRLEECKDFIDRWNDGRWERIRRFEGWMKNKRVLEKDACRTKLKSAFLYCLGF